MNEPMAPCRVLAFILACLALPVPAAAQVVFDGTIGTSGTAPTRSLDGRTDYEIRQDRGERVEAGGRTNLFHSFSMFDLSASESATFLAVDPVDTIIARVTSGSPSVISGRLRSEVPGADLFFVNPSGITFTETAELELPASFFATTADFIRFEDGTAFDATAPLPVVTAAAPSAFGFLGGAMSGDITIEGTSAISVATGETFSVVGGNVTVRGQRSIFAKQGRIEVGAAGSAALEIPLDLSNWSPSADATPDLGRVEVADLFTTLETVDFGDLDANQGRIVIRGGEFHIDGGIVTAGGDGSGPSAIDIETTRSVDVIDSRVSVIAGGSADIDGIRIDSQTITVEGTAFTPTGVHSEIYGTGGAGDIVITAGELVVRNGGQIRSDANGTGRGANIVVDADRVEGSTLGAIVSRTTSGAATAGDAGSIHVTADELAMQSGARIDGATVGAGRAADITLVVVGEAAFDGETSGTPSGIFARSGLSQGATAEGDGGTISVQTGDLRVTGGAQVSSSSRGVGDSGNVVIVATGAVVVKGSGTLESGIFTTGTIGRAGDIDIEAGSVRVADGGRLDSLALASGQAINGGNITITTKGGVIEIADGAQLNTDVRGIDGTGGDVVMNADSIVVNSSSVTANANAANAEAGNIYITVQDGYFKATGPDTTVEATNSLGVDGQVIVDGPVNQVVGDLVALEADFIDASSQLQEACAARDSESGSFSVQRGRAPPAPPDQVLDPTVSRETMLLGDGTGRCEDPR